MPEQPVVDPVADVADAGLAVPVPPVGPVGPATSSQRLWLRSFGYLAAGEAATSVLRFAALVWIARQLGPSAFGTVTVGLVVGNYLQIVAQSGLEVTGTRELAAHHDRAVPLLGHVVALALLLAGALWALTVVVTAALPLSGQVQLTIIVFGLSAFTLAGNVRWSFIAIQRTRAVAVGSLLASCTYLAGAVLLVRRPSDVVKAAVLYVVGEAVLSTALVVASRRRFGSWRPRIERDHVRPTLAQSLPIMVMLGARSLVISVDVVLVKVLRPAADAGHYAAASRIALTGIVFLGLYYNAFLPSLVRAVHDPDQFRALVRVATRRALVLGPPVAVVIDLVAPVAVHGLFGSSYDGTTSLLQVLVWGLVLLALTGVQTQVLLARHHQRQLAVIMVVALAFNVAANLVLLPTVGTVGAAIATVLTEAVVLGLTWAAAHRLVPSTGDLAAVSPAPAAG